MKACKECHHTPSCRFDAAGAQCRCRCHDLADLAPECMDAVFATDAYFAESARRWRENEGRILSTKDAAAVVTGEDLDALASHAGLLVMQLAERIQALGYAPQRNDP